MSVYIFLSVFQGRVASPIPMDGLSTQFRGSLDLPTAYSKIKTLRVANTVCNGISWTKLVGENVNWIASASIGHNHLSFVRLKDAALILCPLPFSHTSILSRVFFPDIFTSPSLQCWSTDFLNNLNSRFYWRNGLRPPSSELSEFSAPPFASRNVRVLESSIIHTWCRDNSLNSPL